MDVVWLRYTFAMKVVDVCLYDARVVNACFYGRVNVSSMASIGPDHSLTLCTQISSTLLRQHEIIKVRVRVILKEKNRY